MTFDKWWEENLAVIKASYKMVWEDSRSSVLKEWLSSEKKVARKLPVIK